MKTRPSWILPCLLLLLACGCHWGRPAPGTINGVRLGESLADVQKKFGPKNLPALRAKDKEFQLTGKDGGALYVYVDKQNQVYAVRVTSRDFPGTPEGVKVGDTKEKMIKVYGTDYVERDERETEGYAYHYRRGKERLTFIFENYKAPRIQRIIMDSDLESLKQ